MRTRRRNPLCPVATPAHHKVFKVGYQLKTIEVSLILLDSEDVEDGYLRGGCKRLAPSSSLAVPSEQHLYVLKGPNPANFTL